MNYPAADTAFIGLFMTAHDRQGCGLGSRILRDCMARLSAAGYHRLRLAVDDGDFTEASHPLTVRERFERAIYMLHRHNITAVWSDGRCVVGKMLQ